MSTQYNYVRKFYGNEGVVRKLLQRAIINGRDKKGYTNLELDGVCMFGQDGFPSMDECEANPDRINRKVFCRASFPLDLTADTALEINDHVSDDDIKEIVKDMAKTGVHSVRYCGGDGKPIKLEDQARVYVVLKILEEIS